MVTGLGLVTAIGLDEASVWSSLIAGRSGLRTMRLHPLEGNLVQNGAELDATPFEPGLPPGLRRADRSLKFACEAARQALGGAGRLGGPAGGTQDIASIWGSAAGTLETLHQAFVRFAGNGPKGMRPSAVPKCMSNSLSANISINFQITGANYVIVSACTSSTNAIGVAFRMIQEGQADAVLCGGTEASFSPFYYACWNNLGVLSTIPDPARALRSFAADRAGTLLGEGAGALLLESRDSALRRGVRIRGEIVGYGESSDATHITAPSVAGQSKAIRAALANAGIGPADIGYINPHGTGTEANDATESQAINEALGAAAATIPVGATKPYFGHTLGASGAIETICTLLALEHRRMPPSLNLENPDPACSLCFAGPQAAPLAADYAMKNSFGFGGGNAVLILRRSPL